MEEVQTQINFGYALLKQKVDELRENEAIYIPPRFLLFIEKFLNEEKFSCENVYISVNRFAIKFCEKDGIMFYLLVYPSEGWIIKNNEIIWRTRERRLVYVHQVLRLLDKFIRVRYHIEKLYQEE